MKNLGDAEKRLLEDFEKQLSDITDYYNQIVNLRERQKDDGIMIRIFLDEIEGMYGRLYANISVNTVLPENVKTKLLELVQWELQRAQGREAVIEEYEAANQSIFSQGYNGELAENSKLEAPFSIMADVYNTIRSVRKRQKDDGIMGRLYLNELLPTYHSIRAKVFASSLLTDGIKEQLLALIDEEIKQAPIREEEIIKAERAIAEEYTAAYNAALARYEALSSLLKLKYADQLKRLKDDSSFKTIDEINKFFIPEKRKPLFKKEKPDAPGDDGEHDGH